MERNVKLTVEETFGTVSLRIARLENELRLLDAKQQLSRAYPDYQAKLTLQQAATQLQLNQMLAVRDQFIRTC